MENQLKRSAMGFVMAYLKFFCVKFFFSYLIFHSSYLKSDCYTNIIEKYVFKRTKHNLNLQAGARFEPSSSVAIFWAFSRPFVIIG